jgi:heme exporter protein B
MLREIVHLVQKDLLLEMRQKHAIGGVLLYVLSTIFVAYLSFRQIIDINTWNALFWIILLFTAFNATAKSFHHEKDGLALYWYTLASPQGVILAKMIYNILLMLVLGLLSLFFFSLFIGGDLLWQGNVFGFLLALVLGTSGIATVLTMIAAIASKTNNALGIMAILGMPVVLPLMLTIIRFSRNSMMGIPVGDNWKNVLFLLMINAIVVALSYVLFPYLWRD